MDDLYSLIVNIIKEAGASNGATLELLIQKGLIDEEDIKRWEMNKAKHLAKLDQAQAAVSERVAKQVQEEQARIKAAQAKNPPKDPIKALIDFITGNGPPPGV